MPRGTNYTEDSRLYILGLIKNGQSIQSVSEGYNIAQSTIRRWIKKYSYSTTEVVDLRNKIKSLEKENQRLRWKY